MSLSPTQALLDAAKLTVSFSSVYGIAMIHQVVVKQRLISQKRKMGQVLDRYDCPDLLSADRLVANILEWSPMFLGPVWSLAAVDRLDERCLQCAWGYVGLRGIYLVLVVKCGVSKEGRNKSLWGSTFPGYLCLTFLWKRSLEILSL
mmetsp:Transcript_17490/g.37805  ORF Transcript_17490/g.37805 Transcript_17490/m.37805 type:complete len:147 (-) Transcript_17490:1469-1909(-)